MSQKPWSYWLGQRKATGCETLNYGQLKFSINSDVQLSKDETLYVVRFNTYQGEGKARIVGFKIPPCAVFHVIGYDFDFTAYAH